MAVVQPADMAVKANEILARFRPIAPKPSAQAAAEGVVATNRALCQQLQSIRPCPDRKRGRPSLLPAAKRKRAAKAHYPPLRCGTTTTDAASVVVPASACVPTTASLPLGSEEKVAEKERDVPVERDLLRKLLEPTLISPRAVRPVGSTVRVESVIRRADPAIRTAAVSKTAVDVEVELEADALPALVSDSGNRVRLVNDAYKEMVGQPECPWLRAVAAASRRISGEVVLVVAEQASSLPESHGVPFTCRARIEWECDGKCVSISVPCDVTRLQCESRDYLFTWRFRTSGADATVTAAPSR